jgi:hypothetical protein
MKAYEHIERAGILIAEVDQNFDATGKSTTRWAHTPVGLVLAQAHLELAHMKAAGGEATASEGEGATARAMVVALVADLASTIADPTQAWDIAVVDFNDAIERLDR